ncbi:MAG TPA: nucleotidyltransferase family protein, partial [Longimicrobium sp.]|nr:nucleotidyltransferase family protein [Longimicrobium sp.]
MSPRALRHAAEGALRLRAWALPVLAGAPPTLPPAVDAQSWSVFLAIERCALPLRDALAAEELLEAADAAAQAALDARAVNEAMHVLALRREAAGVAVLLRRHGWEGVVLKGGATVLGGGRELDVQDLDLLLPPGQARALAAVLDGAGYERKEADLPPGAPNRHQLAGRMRPGGMLVEVHVDLAPVGENPDPGGDSLPLPVAGLRRLRPAAHLWHVLTHGALHHPERRGAL